MAFSKRHMNYLYRFKLEQTPLFMYKSLFRLYVLGAFILAGTAQGLAQDTQVSVSIKDLQPEVRIDLGEGIGEVKLQKINCTSKGLPVHYIEVTYLGIKKEGVSLAFTALSNGSVDERVLLQGTQWNVPFAAKKESWNCTPGTMPARRLILLAENGSVPFMDTLVVTLK